MLNFLEILKYVFVVKCDYIYNKNEHGYVGKSDFNFANISLDKNKIFDFNFIHADDDNNRYYIARNIDNKVLSEYNDNVNNNLKSDSKLVYSFQNEFNKNKQKFQVIDIKTKNNLSLENIESGVDYQLKLNNKCVYANKADESLYLGDCDKYINENIFNNSPTININSKEIIKNDYKNDTFTKINEIEVGPSKNDISSKNKSVRSFANKSNIKNDLNRNTVKKSNYMNLNSVNDHVNKSEENLLHDSVDLTSKSVSTYDPVEKNQLNSNIKMRVTDIEPLEDEQVKKNQLKSDIKPKVTHIEQSKDNLVKKIQVKPSNTKLEIIPESQLKSPKPRSVVTPISTIETPVEEDLDLIDVFSNAPQDTSNNIEPENLSIKKMSLKPNQKILIKPEVPPQTLDLKATIQPTSTLNVNYEESPQAISVVKKNKPTITPLTKKKSVNKIDNIKKSTNHNKHKKPLKKQQSTKLKAKAPTNHKNPKVIKRFEEDVDLLKSYNYDSKIKEKTRNDIKKKPKNLSISDNSKQKLNKTKVNRQKLKGDTPSKINKNVNDTLRKSDTNGKYKHHHRGESDENLSHKHKNVSSDDNVKEVLHYKKKTKVSV